jgi:hypothetical protein
MGDHIRFRLAQSISSGRTTNKGFTVQGNQDRPGCQRSRIGIDQRGREGRPAFEAILLRSLASSRLKGVARGSRICKAGRSPEGSWMCRKPKGPLPGWFDTWRLALHVCFMRRRRLRRRKGCRRPPTSAPPEQQTICRRALRECRAPRGPPQWPALLEARRNGPQ